MEEKYYCEHDPEYETMPWRIYQVTNQNTGKSIEIAKSYNKEDAQTIVSALNKLEFDLN